MAKGIAPLFTTAPRIKIKINDIDLAFAIGLTVNVSVDLQPVRVIGEFGPISIEPTQYNPITGSMQIIRLVSTESIANQLAALNALVQANDFNQTKQIVASDAGENEINVNDISAAGGFDSNSPLTISGLFRHLSPSEVLLSRMFDIDLYMKIPNSANAGVQSAFDQNFTNDAGLLPNKDAAGVDQEVFTEVPWMRFKQCRITSRNVNISRGQFVNEPVSFQGLMATPLLGSPQNFRDGFTLDQGATQGTVPQQ